MLVDWSEVHLVDFFVQKDEFTVDGIGQLKVEPQENQQRNKQVMENQLTRENDVLHCHTRLDWEEFQSRKHPQTHEEAKNGEHQEKGRKELVHTFHRNLE